MHFQEESLVDLFDELIPMIQDHHEETSLHKDIVLEPDFAKYEQLAEIGVYQIFTVRGEEEELVGYAGFFVSPMLHFKNSQQAICDLMYVKPEYRGNGVGKHFISFVDDSLQAKGVNVVFHHVPANNDWSIILKDKGYVIHDHVYSRRL